MDVTSDQSELALSQSEARAVGCADQSSEAVWVLQFSVGTRNSVKNTQYTRWQDPTTRKKSMVTRFILNVETKKWIPLCHYIKIKYLQQLGRWAQTFSATQELLYGHRGHLNTLRPVCHLSWSKLRCWDGPLAQVVLLVLAFSAAASSSFSI